MNSNHHQQREEIAQISQELHQRGWVANHDGNITVRLSGGNLLATPTAVSKRKIREDSLLLLDATGQLISGRGKPFSELGLHLAVYRTRPDVQAVIHAHPPAATGFAVAQIELGEPFLPEAVVSLGPKVTTAPFAP